jgi:hypothetical protein
MLTVVIQINAIIVASLIKVLFLRIIERTVAIKLDTARLSTIPALAIAMNRIIIQTAKIKSVANQPLVVELSYVKIELMLVMLGVEYGFQLVFNWAETEEVEIIETNIKVKPTIAQ